MKKILALLLLTFFVVSCSEENNSQTNNGSSETTVKKSGEQLDCLSDAPIGALCGGGIVIGKHIIVTQGGCTGGENPTCKGGADTYSDTWDYAIKYCDNMNLNGYSDWYLPASNEILDIFVSNERTKILGGGVFSDTYPRSGLNGYWSSTPHEKNKNYAYGLGLTSTSTSEEIKSSDLHVRCIRHF